MVPRLFRTGAIGLALVAWLDPAISSARTERPLVSLVAPNASQDAELADLVARELEREFTVVRGALGAADGTVIVGSRPPDSSGGVAAPIFGVTGTTSARSIVIESIDIPPRVPPDARVPVTIRARVRGLRGSEAQVVLQAGGAVVDRTDASISADTALLEVHLNAVSGASGLHPVEVIVRAGSANARATAATRIEAVQWRVLFFDTRPTWSSTFVRRVVERDPRFVVTARVATSRGAASQAGEAPASLRDAETLKGFDLIVVGAPDALTRADVTGVERYLRRRGGSVILLLDERTAGPWQSLTGVQEWRAARTTTPTPIGNRAPVGPGLMATELLWPARLPSGATVLSSDSVADRPLVWQTPVGAGRVIVNGTLDAWHFRDPSESGFEQFWRLTAAEAAASSPPAIDVTLNRARVAPGEPVRVRATIRDVRLDQVVPDRRWSATISATLESRAEDPRRLIEPDEVTLWPEPEPGVFSGELRAPLEAGPWRIVVQQGDTRSDAAFLVDTSAVSPIPDERSMLAALASSHGGASLDASRIAELPALLRAALAPGPRVETWYPMRSPLWIVPFALALGVEWWWRRRRSLA